MKSRTADHIRSFGMSGLLITDDLRNLENRFGIEQWHAPVSSAADPLDYYPHFEQTVRSEAAQMSRHYEVFYCLEKAIRKLISETLQESESADWWGSGRIP